MRRMKIGFRTFCSIAWIFTLSSCFSTKNAVYFNNLSDTVINSKVENLEPVIHKNDLLSISVSSINPEATLIFNVPNGSAAQTATGISGNGNMPASGYLVNQDGDIQFPVLGNIKAEGLTKKQLKEEITKGLVDRKLLLDPIVSVRYLNFRVTVLGEVAHPAVLNVPSEKITLLEALGLAGDMTVFAKRSNVMVIREEDNQKIIKRLNLNSTELLNSPYYYLKSNDIVYVEPTSAKVATASNTRQWLPMALSALSFIAIVFDRVIRIR